jgi:LPXTG-motif cell wall-anchored protein
VVDEDGTPQGEWSWDPDDEVWVLEPYTPLAPPTGDRGAPLWISAALAASCAAAFVLTRKRKKTQ